MIKFFRRLRQQLLTENKIGKYLMYASGEIILVVIGIIIALQLNNWNEGRKEIARSKNYLTEIVKDLESDTLTFNFAIKQLANNIEVEDWVLNQPDYQGLQVDSIWVSFGGFYFDHTMNDRTFQKIQNAGDTKLMGYESLSDDITFYYTQMKYVLNSYTAWDQREVTQRQEYMRELESHLELSNSQMQRGSKGLLLKSFPTRQDSLEQIRLTIEFANSIQGRNHFKNNYTRHLRVKNIFEKVNHKAVELIGKITQELNQPTE